jgi:hypothetical protein
MISGSVNVGPPRAVPIASVATASRPLFVPERQKAASLRFEFSSCSCPKSLSHSEGYGDWYTKSFIYSFRSPVPFTAGLQLHEHNYSSDYYTRAMSAALPLRQNSI